MKSSAEVQYNREKNSLYQETLHTGEYSEIYCNCTLTYNKHKLHITET
jgi:hypothetical protein